MYLKPQSQTQIQTISIHVSFMSSCVRGQACWPIYYTPGSSEPGIHKHGVFLVPLPTRAIGFIGQPGAREGRGETGIGKEAYV